ncbi:MAG: DNA translocase FtsK [Clostridia bacterium]
MATQKSTAKTSKTQKAKTSQSKANTKEIKTTENKGKKPEKKKMNKQLVATIMFFSSILMGAIVFIQGEALWYWLHCLFTGLFGIWAILWPVLFMYLAVITALEKQSANIAVRISLTAGIIIMICSTVHIFSGAVLPEETGFWAGVVYWFNAGTVGQSAGLIGVGIGELLVLILGVLGAKIVSIILIIVLAMILTGITLLSLIKAVTKPAKVVGKGIKTVAEKKKEERIKKQEEAEIDSFKEEFEINPTYFQPAKNKKVEKKETSLDNLNKVFGIKTESDEPKVETVIEDISSSSEVSFKEKETAKEEHNEANNEANNEVRSVAVPSSVATPINTSQEVLEDVAKAAEEFIKKKEEAEKNEIATNAQMALYDGKEDYQYCFPPLHLLATAPKNNAEIQTKQLQSVGIKLVDTLQSFGVQTKITDICAGPSVTRYELQPAPGVKISKITNLADDIALNLAATGVRIEAPIPGKAAVGIEIPNKIKNIVRMRELIESNQFIMSKSNLTVVLGRDIAGQVQVADLAKMPHTLIAGTTGSGKSVCINSLVISLIYKSSPDDVRFLMIDPKVVELGIYNGIPHLLVPVVTDPRKAAGALNWAVTEMLNRYKIFAEYNVKDLTGYNQMAKLNEYEDENGQPMLKMPQVVIIIDELADLMMAAPHEVEDSICRLAQMARAAGMHLVVATQRPTVDVVTGLIKANIPSRIAFAVSSAIDSRTILDSQGAEKLLGQGDMLYSPVGNHKPTRIQGCFVTETEIEAIVEFVKKSRVIEYDEKIIEDIEKNAVLDNSKSEKSDNQGSDDPMMSDAIKCVVDAGQASTSLLQRRLRLGYARAGRLIDEMEQMGIVGPHEGSKPRQVLMTHNQWLERNMQKSDEEV